MEMPSYHERPFKRKMKILRILYKLLPRSVFCALAFMSFDDRADLSASIVWCSIWDIDDTCLLEIEYWLAEGKFYDPPGPGSL